MSIGSSSSKVYSCHLVNSQEMIHFRALVIPGLLVQSSGLVNSQICFALGPCEFKRFDLLSHVGASLDLIHSDLMAFPLVLVNSRPMII